MRSAQFDDHVPFEDELEQHRRRSDPEGLCETLRRVVYRQKTQMKVYGRIFDLVSDPFCAGENLVFVDAREQESGHLMRVRVPPTVVQMAKKKSRTA